VGRGNVSVRDTIDRSKKKLRRKKIGGQPRVRKRYQTRTTAKPINMAATTPMKAGKPTD